ncbi:MAG TPA: histidine triad nucleotide-binding protein [Ignavibacteriaceae bacterium]|nr:histidine triad nucleotide-binding protein [Ignavibacteriaceae bacterium]
MSENTIFAKIIRKEIPADIVFENENVLAFRDINPQAPVHILIIPKRYDLPKISDFETDKHKDILAELFSTANKIAEQLNIAKEGYRLVINCGDNAGQEVLHLHLHLLGGRKMNWPPG